MVPLKQMELKPSTKEALKLAGLEKCIKRSQRTHLGGNWGCFMESQKASLLLHCRSYMYLAAQYLLLSLQIFS